MADSQYGEADATHVALGGVDGIRCLVEVFYHEMETLPSARRIRDLHPSDLEVSIDKLARFLSGWTGGPKLYSEKYGPIKIPIFHQHLPVGEEERDAWMLCMERALDQQDYPETLQAYMLKELFVPADRIRVVVADRKAARAAEGGDGAAESGGSTPIKGLEIRGRT
jgi:hemoglobin